MVYCVLYSMQEYSIAFLYALEQGFPTGVTTPWRVARDHEVSHEIKKKYLN
jgi:hypothetical protein